MREHEEANKFSHPIVRNWVEPVKNTELPHPVNFAVLGNTTGTQYLAVLDTTGILWVIRSNDTFTTLLSTQRLDTFDVQDLGGVGLSMGFAQNGSVFVGADYEDSYLSWVQGEDGIFEAHPISPFGPTGPTVKREDLPEPRFIRTPHPGWDTVWLDGMEVVVLGYYYESGCQGNLISPSIVYRQPGDEWSYIVQLGRSNLDHVAIDGTGMDDMLIVAYNGLNGHWLIYSISDTTVFDAGQPQV